MNEQDKKAFEDHLEVICNKENDYERFFAIWQAACEYKQKEIDELNDLVFAIETNNKSMEEQIDSLEKEKDYLCQKMENLRNIYKEAEKLQAAFDRIQELEEQNKELQERLDKLLANLNHK